MAVLRSIARSALVIAAALTASGCTVQPEDMDMLESDVETSVDGISVASSYNHALRSHYATWVGLRNDTALLDRDGNPFGPTLSAFGSGGTVRIQGNERVWDADRSEWLYYVWGGSGVKSGFVGRNSLVSTPAINGDDGGNGTAAPLNCRTYFIRPTEIPTDLRFDRHDGDGTQTLATYGTPGAVHAPAFGDYTYLTWNVVNVDGGGLVRSILRDGAVFHAANVRRVVIQSVDHPGSVAFMYGFARQGGHRVWGWTTIWHEVDGHRTYHATLRSTNDC